jgi:hypothetical protein
MRPQIILSLEQLVRNELALQRRLGACRRAASALMPILRRTGIDKMRPPMPTPHRLKLADGPSPAPRQSSRD